MVTEKRPYVLQPNWKVVRQEANIRADRAEITIIWKDTNEIITNEKVREALEKQFDLIRLQESAMKALKKVYGGTQTDISSLPIKAAPKPLAAGRVGIDLILCRLMEQVERKRCLRCLEFAHDAKVCTSSNPLTAYWKRMWTPWGHFRQQ